MPSAAVALEFSVETVEHYAPVVELAKGERNFPASVPWFLNRSTLEWHYDADHCPPSPIHGLGSWSRHDMTALGKGGYTAKARDGNCRETGRIFASDEHTRPTDGGRPASLGYTEGFALNLQGTGADVRSGMTDTTPGTPETYTGAPAYYESGELAKPGAPLGAYMYMTYWFFYSYDSGPARQEHEGDWEGMSIIFRQTAPGRYRPVELGLNQHTGTQGIAWMDRRFTGVRPLVFSANGTHATYDHAFGLNDHLDETGGGPLWHTDARLLPVGAQPWAGYCGAWGQVGEIAGLFHLSFTTGPLGPGCVVSGRLIKSAIPEGWGAPAPLRRRAPGVVTTDV